MPTTKPARPPAMHDVARDAGVSHQTVSRVLNDHPHVRPETRAKVLAVIEELGYRRNTAARALATARSGTIGVLTTRSALYGPTSILLSVESAARERGLFVSLASLAETHEAAMRDGIQHFMDQSVEGIVVIGASAEFVETAASVARRLPIVNVSALVHPRPGVLVATVDNARGARLAVNHLVTLRHREIAHVRGPLDSLEAVERERGWRSALKRAGLPPGPLLVGDWSARSGHDAGLAVAAGRLPDAVFVANDEMTLGLLRAFSQSGISVPRDVSVVGFDDIAGADFASPPLTTVRQDFALLGERCLLMLMQAMAGDPPSKPTLISPTLLIRQSTAVRSHLRGQPAAKSMTTT